MIFIISHRSFYFLMFFDSLMMRGCIDKNSIDLIIIAIPILNEKKAQHDHVSNSQEYTRLWVYQYQIYFMLKSILLFKNTFYFIGNRNILNLFVVEHDQEISPLMIPRFFLNSYLELT